jgi:hypothetical protein
MALFSKVIGTTGNMGYTSGAAPKGIMLSPGVTIKGTDMYDNVIEIAVPTSANGGHTKIFPVRLKHIQDCVGATAYMLW